MSYVCKMKEAIEILERHNSSSPSADLERALKLLKHHQNYHSDNSKYYKILSEICECYGVDIDFILSKSRKGKCNMITRHVISYLAFAKIKNKSEVAILMDRHHSSIINSINHVEHWLTMPDKFEEEMEILNQYELSNNNQ